MRFDCDLSQDVDYPEMKKHKVEELPAFYYQHGLSPKLRREIDDQTRKLSSGNYGELAGSEKKSRDQ
jgi:hypothetical protein